MEKLESRTTRSITPFLPPQTILDTPIEAPATVEIRDLNSDGLADLVFSTGRGMQWMRQTPTGFALPVQLTPQNWLQLADLNGDGAIDGLGRVFSGSGVNYLNDMQGKFRELSWSTAGGVFRSSEPYSLFDVDRDGDLDLAFIGRDFVTDFQGLGWRANDGQGAFGDFQPLIPLTHRRVLSRSEAQLADLDGDGDWDAVTVEPHPERVFDYVVRWYENGPNGVISHQVPLELPLTANATVSFADATGDGLPEILVSIEGDSLRPPEMVIFERNTVSGQYERWSHPSVGEQADELQFADLDRDGDLDAIRRRANQLDWFPRQADGSLAAQALLLATYSSPISDLAVGDLDADGSLDLVVVSQGYDQVTIWKNDGRANFVSQSLNESPIDAVVEILPADLDGDSKVDLVLRGDQLWWMRATDGAGHFEPPRVLLDRTLHVLHLLDVDGDGDTDLASSDGQLWLLLNDGRGTMTRQELGLAGRHLTVTDWDQDGDLDLLTVTTRSEISDDDGTLLSWYENRGRGQFATLQTLINLSSHAALEDWDIFGPDKGAAITDLQAVRVGDGRMRVAVMLEQRLFDLFAVVLVGSDELGRVITSDAILRVREDDYDVRLVVADTDQSGTDELITAILPSDSDERTTYGWYDVSQGATTSLPFSALQESVDTERLREIEYIAPRWEWLSLVVPQVGWEFSRRVGSYTDGWPSLPQPIDVNGDGQLDLVAMQSGKLFWLENATRQRDWWLDGRIDQQDIDTLSRAILDRSTDLAFDVDADGRVGPNDLSTFVRRELSLHPADVNFDGRFDSSDLVAVFQHGKFETRGPVVWTEGDFDGDGKFSSSDLVLAFQMGYFSDDDD